MNPSRKDSLAFLSLVVLSSAAGVAWRAELELRGGWAGLTWLRYFHWAVPVSVAAFIAWAAWVAPVRSRFRFIAAMIGFAVLGHVVAGMALRCFFVAGPAAMMTAGSLGNGDVELGMRRLEVLRWIAPVVWTLIPLSFCLLCRLCGAPVTWLRAVTSAVLFMISGHIAIFVRGFFEQSGSPDLIHALKSGFVVPALVLSLGFPLLRLKTSP